MKFFGTGEAIRTERSATESAIRQPRIPADELGKKIQDLTIKELFEKSFGQRGGGEILAEIQQAYDQGARGSEFKAKVDEIVGKHKLTTMDHKDDIVNEAATIMSSGSFIPFL